LAEEGQIVYLTNTNEGVLLLDENVRMMVRNNNLERIERSFDNRLNITFYQNPSFLAPDDLRLTEIQCNVDSTCTCKFLDETEINI